MLALAGVVATASLVFAQPAVAVTIPVTTTDDELTDNDDCSLREAIEAANNDSDAHEDACEQGSGSDLVALETDTYELTLGAAGEDANAGGDLDVEESLTIDGTGAGASVIDAEDLDRAIDVEDADPATVSVMIRNLTVTDGLVSGEDGGGVRSAEDEPAALLTISSAVLAVNETSGGGGAVSAQGRVSLLRSDLGDNEAGETGGALWALGDATVTESDFAGNSADDRGGAISSDAGLTVTASDFSANVAGAGGGISARGGLVVRRSTMASNRSDEPCAVPDEGDGGGAIDIQGTAAGAALLENSTLSANTAACTGGGIYVRNTNDTLTVRHTAIANGKAAIGGAGIDNEDDPNSSRVALRGSILTANRIGAAVRNCGGDGVRVTLGFNLESRSGCRLRANAGDRSGTDPQLGVLAFNGGRTRTHLPVTTSPAVNAISSGCPLPSVDQRGSSRPVAGRCDIGPVEVSPAPFCLGRAATLAGNASSEHLVGTRGRDVIVAEQGADTIEGLGGGDLICAGHGGDRVIGAGGKDKVDGGGGNDRVSGGSGPDLLFGGGGRDRLRGMGGSDRLFGLGGRDRLKGGPGSDSLRGGPGRDRLNGGSGRNLIIQ